MQDSGLEWDPRAARHVRGKPLDWADAIRTEGVGKAPHNAARQSPVHELDIAAVAATALLFDGHHGKITPCPAPRRSPRPNR